MKLGGLMMNRKLYKSRQNKVFSGVCGGIGEYLNVDPVVIRVIWLILVFAFGTGLLAYLLCLLIMPNAPYDV